MARAYTTLPLTVLLLAISWTAAPGQTTIWSTPTNTERVNPRSMERAEVVQRPGPLDGRVVGSWELWVPGGVWYSSDGRSVYRHYTPGAAMNRLTIAADGSYRWDRTRGKLVEVRPWHAQEGRRYYRLTHPGGMEYELYFNERNGSLTLLFGGVGGHAATGSPVAGRQPAAAGAVGPAGAAYGAGDRVQVLWSGVWYDADVVRVEGERYRIHYVGWDSSWDEWVGAERIRRVGN